jgi:transposase
VPAASIPKPRREFPAHLARETQTIAPPQSSCPDCGSELKYLGEDVCEMLELEPMVPFAESCCAKTTFAKSHDGRPLSYEAAEVIHHAWGHDPNHS